MPSASNRVDKHAYILEMNRIREQTASLRLKKKISINYGFYIKFMKAILTVRDFQLS